MEIQENDFIEEDDIISTSPPMDVIAFNELRSTSDIVRQLTSVADGRSYTICNTYLQRV